MFTGVQSLGRGLYTHYAVYFWHEAKHNVLQMLEVHNINKPTPFATLSKRGDEGKMARSTKCLSLTHVDTQRNFVWPTSSKFPTCIKMFSYLLQMQ